MANQAAWIEGNASQPFIVKEAPKPQPGPDEVIIKTAVVAINPVDYKMQDAGLYSSANPFVLGDDGAGIVQEVGQNVTGFKKGDRVIAHADGLRSKDPKNSSFQLYFAAQSRLTSLVPAKLSLEKAVVLPLAISTAAAGLYDPALLGLPLPSADSATVPAPAAGEKIKTVLIWGGSSSVGTAAIQLAVASGAHVITTASPQNHDLVRSLGASAVFDYHSKTIVRDLVDALKDTSLVGVYDAIALDSSTEAVSAILDALDKKLPVANVLGTQRKTERYQPQFIFSTSVVADNLSFIAEGVWGKYVPAALANGSLQAKPDGKVVGHGLESIQGAVDLLRKGVSAQKLIVTL